VAEGGEYGEGEREVVRGGLAAVLDQRVLGVGGGEVLEVGVGMVEVVDGDDGCGEGVGWSAEGRAEGADLWRGCKRELGEWKVWVDGRGNV